MLSRRDLYKLGTFVLGGALALGLAIPGLAFVLDPLRRKARTGLKRELTRLDALPVGEPKAFPILDERRDAWVQYPSEPIGSVWLVRQPEGVEPPVRAFTAECPHLGCAIKLDPAGAGFECPCHKAKFAPDGRQLNGVAPRGMDELPVELKGGADPVVVVTFGRFRNQLQESIPLV